MSNSVTFVSPTNSTFGYSQDANNPKMAVGSPKPLSVDTVVSINGSEDLSSVIYGPSGAKVSRIELKRVNGLVWEYELQITGCGPDGPGDLKLAFADAEGDVYYETLISSTESTSKLSYNSNNPSITAIWWYSGTSSFDIPPSGYLAVGVKNTLWVRAALNIPWNEVPSSGDVKCVTIADDVLIGIGTDGYLWSRANVYSSSWNKVGNQSRKFISVCAFNNMLYAVGDDYHLYTANTNTPIFTMAAGNNIKVLSVAVLNDGTVIGVTKGGEPNTPANILCKKSAVDSEYNWIPILNTGSVKTIVVDWDGVAILGVGMDNAVYRRAGLEVGSWALVPYSASILSLTPYSYY